MSTDSSDAFTSLDISHTGANEHTGQKFGETLLIHENVNLQSPHSNNRSTTLVASSGMIHLPHILSHLDMVGVKLENTPSLVHGWTPDVSGVHGVNYR